MNSNTETQQDIEDAVCLPDEKLQPDDVPICNFTGVAKLPATEGYTLLVFKSDDSGTVGVRLDDNEIEELAFAVDGVVHDG